MRFYSGVGTVMSLFERDEMNMFRDWKSGRVCLWFFLSILLCYARFSSDECLMGDHY